MRASEIRRLTEGELQQAIDDSKQEMFNLRFQWEAGQLEDATRIRQLRRDLARLKTIQRERQLAAQVIQQEDHNA